MTHRTIDWHEKGLDWALADALDPAPGSSRDWTCNDMARAFAAGAAAAAERDRARQSAEPDLGAWLPIETAPESGYYMVYEDGACRLKLHHDGQWHEAAYAAIECTLTGEVAVGQDAQLILDLRATAGAYKLVMRDGSCENPTHWRHLPAPPADPNPPIDARRP